MNILGIESSCDETAAAIIQNGRQIKSSIIFSQIDLFSAYGGVIPEIAARSHLETILPVIHQAFDQAHLDWDQIDAIAVTHTPGLLGSLLIGTLTARTLALLHHKPLYPVHHLKSHIYSIWLQPHHSTSQPNQPTLQPNHSTSQPHQSNPPSFPLIALLVSGGHTQLIYMENHNHFQIIGTTRDDAIGECFDKIAKILGLPYPGGPAIANAAQTGNPHRYHFPHPKVDHLDFSFSGLKTAVLRSVQKELNLPITHPSNQLAKYLTPTQISDFAASFQNTAIDILLKKLDLALESHPDTKSVIIAGGVSANQLLRIKASSKYPHLFFPAPGFSGDNAAMVASAAFYEIQSKVPPTDPYHLNILPRSAIS